MTFLNASVMLILKHNSDWEDMDSDNDEEEDSDSEEFDENFPVAAYGQAILTVPNETDGQVLYR